MTKTQILEQLQQFKLAIEKLVNDKKALRAQIEELKSERIINEEHDNERESELSECNNYITEQKATIEKLEGDIKDVQKLYGEEVAKCNLLTEQLTLITKANDEGTSKFIKLEDELARMSASYTEATSELEKANLTISELKSKLEDVNKNYVTRGQVEAIVKEAKEAAYNEGLEKCRQSEEPKTVRPVVTAKIKTSNWKSINSAKVSFNSDAEIANLMSYGPIRKPSDISEAWLSESIKSVDGKYYVSQTADVEYSKLAAKILSRLEVEYKDESGLKSVMPVVKASGDYVISNYPPEVIVTILGKLMEE